VGKTTLAVNLAAGLADAGKRVLLIDLDPQGSASEYLNAHANEDAPHLADVLTRGANIADAAVGTELSERLSIVPGDLALSRLSWELKDPSRLKAALASIAGRELVVIIDTPPGWGMLTVNALAAARYAIAPVEPKHLSLVALVRLVGMVEDVKREHNRSLELAAVVPFRVQRTRLSRECLEDLNGTFGAMVFPSIRESARVAEAPGYHLPVTRYAPDSIGAEDFKALTRAVLLKMF